MDVTGKNVFITGSTRGIGEAIALAFAKAGANIFLNGRGEIPAEKINAIKAHGVECVGISGDISDYDKAGEMIKEAEQRLGSVDILVNNAGVTNDKLVLRMDADDFKMFGYQSNRNFQYDTARVKENDEKREGAIINLSSVSGLIGNLGQANYAASKAGVVGFTKSVAREVATRGITCNVIAPGFVTTDMTDVLSEKVREQAEKQIPMQRFGQVEDIAEAALFLAKSSYITGQVINVDGGLVMHG